DQALALDQEAGDSVGQVLHLAEGPRPGVVDDGDGIRILAVDQRDRGVEPLGIVELRQVEAEFGLHLDGRQPVADIMVAMGADHSGTTAIASISTFALGSTRPVTPTTAIAGKCGPITSR